MLFLIKMFVNFLLFHNFVNKQSLIWFQFNVYISTHGINYKIVHTKLHYPILQYSTSILQKYNNFESIVKIKYIHLWIAGHKWLSKVDLFTDMHEYSFLAHTINLAKTTLWCKDFFQLQFPRQSFRPLAATLPHQHSATLPLCSSATLPHSLLHMNVTASVVDPESATTAARLA